MMIYSISEESINSEDAYKLIGELSEILKDITGDSGNQSFDFNDMLNPRAIFVIARNNLGEAVGCGAIRQFNENIAEVKGEGIGTEILTYLEKKANSLGYQRIWLETRIINVKAVNFYEKRGYHRVHNYGKYANNDKAICFEKIL